MQVYCILCWIDRLVRKEKERLGGLLFPMEEKNLAQIPSDRRQTTYAWEVWSSSDFYGGPNHLVWSVKKFSRESAKTAPNLQVKGWKSECIYQRKLAPPWHCWLLIGHDRIFLIWCPVVFRVTVARMKVGNAVQVLTTETPSVWSEWATDTVFFWERKQEAVTAVRKITIIISSNYPTHTPKSITTSRLHKLWGIFFKNTGNARGQHQCISWGPEKLAPWSRRDFPSRCRYHTHDNRLFILLICNERRGWIPIMLLDYANVLWMNVSSSWIIIA